jgi:predicted enzyme related to lactoylglutathione lyase
MGAVETFDHGRFSWLELVTLNQQEAKAFYTSVFGWESVDLSSPSGAYTLLRQGNSDIAGLYEMTEEQREHNLQPHWLTFVSVSDVDEATKWADEGGAVVVNPPTDVGANDRVSIVQDPVGAVIGLRQAGGEGGADVVDAPASFCWSEHVTTRRSEVEEFYSGLLECQIRQADDESSQRSFLRNEGTGLLASTSEPQSEDVAPHWHVYFGVNDIGDTVALVEETRGVVLDDPFYDEGIGHVARIADPQGAVFSILQIEQDEEEEDPDQKYQPAMER